MISAIATGDDGTRLILLGVSRENVTRLTDGKPIRVKAETHPGFPDDLAILIIFGETDSTLAEMVSPVVSDQTQIRIGPGADPDAAQVVKGVALGATGRFPYGQQDATDEGELAVGVATDVPNGVVKIAFGKPIAWVSLPATAAREFAAVLVAKADELERKMS